MAIQQKLYTVDDLWAMESDPAYEDRYFYLIDGRLYEDAMPGRTHARLAIKIGRYLDEYAEAHNLGEVTSECGYYPPDTRYTLLLPDVAYQSHTKLPDPPPKGYVPQMPDLAVEIQSPSDSLRKMRRKAQVYLEHDTALVWLVLPDRQGVEVCRLDADGGLQAKFLGNEDILSGEEVLPGFVLDISKLFDVLKR